MPALFLKDRHDDFSVNSFIGFALDVKRIVFPKIN